MHQIPLTYSRPLLRQAVLGFWWRIVGFRFITALSLVALGLSTLLLQGDSSWLVGVLASALVLGIAFVAALYVVHYRNSIHKLKAMGSPHATLGVSELAFSVSSGAGTATLPWSSITEVWQFKTCWLLLFSKAQFVTLPLTDISPTDQTLILERVRASGGKIG